MVLANVNPAAASDDVSLPVPNRALVWSGAHWGSRRAQRVTRRALGGYRPDAANLMARKGSPWSQLIR